jgi:hypothetical protein
MELIQAFLTEPFKNIWILISISLSPLAFSIDGLIDIVSNSEKHDWPVLTVVFGYLSTLGFALAVNGRVLFLASFFVAVLAGHGAALRMKQLKKWASH